MKQKVLIVDDKPDMTRMLERLLGNSLHLETLTACDAESAQEILKETEVNCLLADLKMPGMGGMGLLRHIMEKDTLLPVIIMTAYGDIDIAVEAMKKGAYDFITKPFEEERLLFTVRRALSASILSGRTEISKEGSGRKRRRLSLSESHPG